MKITATLTGIAITSTNGNGVTGTVFIKLEDFSKVMDAIKITTKINKLNNE